MTTRLLWKNLVDLSATTITSLSENDDLPVSNVAHPHRGRIYRTGVTDADEWIKFDLGSAKAVQAVILLDHTLTASDTTIKLQGNATDVWTSPSVDQTLTFNAGTLAAFLSSAQTYRWWRIVFTKSAAGEYRDVGRVFLGPFYECAKGPAFKGVRITPVDLSETERSRGGQTYSDQLDSYDEIEIEFMLLPDAQMDQFIALAAAVGTHTPWFVQIDSVNKPYEWLYYVKFDGFTKRQVEIKRPAGYSWSVKWKLNEDL